jgi:hypothetical protein
VLMVATMSFKMVERNLASSFWYDVSPGGFTINPGSADTDPPSGCNGYLEVCGIKILMIDESIPIPTNVTDAYALQSAGKLSIQSLVHRGTN